MTGRPFLIAKDLNQLGNLGFQYSQNAAANQLLQQELAQRERQAQFNRQLAQRQFEELSAPQQEAARQYNQALDWSKFQFGNESATQKVQDEINKALVRTQVMNTLLGPGYGGGYGGRSGYGYGGGYGTGLGGLSAYGGPSLTGLSNIGGFQQANTEAQNAFATQQANLQNDRLDAILKEKGGWTGYWTDASKRAAIDEAIKGIPPTPGAKFDAIQRKYIPDTQPPGFGIPGGLGGAGGYGGFAFGAPAEDAITKAARIQILKELFPNADLSSLTAATAPAAAAPETPAAGGGGGGTGAATGIPVWTYGEDGRLLRNGKPVPSAPAEGVPGFIGPPRPPPPPVEGEPDFIGPPKAPPGETAAPSAGMQYMTPYGGIDLGAMGSSVLNYFSRPGSIVNAPGIMKFPPDPSTAAPIVQPQGPSFYEKFWPGLFRAPTPTVAPPEILGPPPPPVTPPSPNLLDPQAIQNLNRIIYQNQLLPPADNTATMGNLPYYAQPPAAPSVIPAGVSTGPGLDTYPFRDRTRFPEPPPPQIPIPPTWLLNPGSAAALNRALSGIGVGTNQLAAPAQGLQYRNLPYYQGR